MTSSHSASYFWVAVTMLGMMASAVPQTTRPPSPPSGGRAPQAATADQAPAPRTERRRGTISGRVVDSAGQPLQAMVYAHAPGAQFGGGQRQAPTDEEGNFRFDNLPAGAYTLNAFVPGFTSQRLTPPDFGAVYYHLGDSVTLQMVKGGVITGRVTKINGEPAVAVPVSAVLVRDAQNRPPSNSSGRSWTMRHTDDRGIYRLFGLAPGTYIVSVNFSQQNFGPFGNPESVPTYHPSATRDTAAELTVREGQELTGVDIQLRGDRGHAVSGSVSGAVSANPMSGPTMIALAHVGTGFREATTYVDGLNSADRTFEFAAIPDGEYEITAQSGGGPYGRSQLTASEPRRITVKGSDVSGLNLQLKPLGSIAGRVIFERLRPTASNAATTAPRCAVAPQMSAQETVLRTRRAEQGSGILGFPFQFPTDTVLAEDGEFTLHNLQTGRYRLQIAPPGDQWYVRAISAPAAAATTRTVRPGAVTANQAEIDVRAGQRVRNVTITIAEGGATLRGRLASAHGETAVPAELVTHLVPTEADDIMRYYQAEVVPNGEFAVRNVAPGRYWLIAAPVSDYRETGDFSQPLAWDAGARAKLRRAAEVVNAAVELRPCEALSDHVLRYPATPNESPADAVKPAAKLE